MKRLFNFFRDHVIEYLFIIAAIAGVFYLAITQGSYAKPGIDSRTAYVDKIFNQSYVHKVEVILSPENYNDLIKNPTEKTKYHAIVTVDGETFEDVGFSTRGNVSLFMVSNREDSDRYSYKLNFQKFGGKDYHGLDNLLLGSLYSDASYMKDHLAFEIMRAAGVASPLTSYTELFINGELQGLYLATEDVNDSFLRRNGFSPDTALYKPEALAIDHSKIKRLEEQLPEGEEINLGEPSSPNFRYEGSDLVYIDDNYDSYNAIFDNAVNKISGADREYLIRSLESLSDFSLADPTDFWNVDALSKYFAASAFLSNFDSYAGIPAHNYYLVAAKGQNTLLPWDFNLGFGDVWIDSTTDTGIDYSDEAINWPIDTPLSVNNPDKRPAWKLIYNNPDYLEKYHNDLQNILDKYVLSGDCVKEINKTAELIRPYVQNDPTKFFSTDEFEEGVTALRAHVLLRADSVQKQLWGLLPTSYDETSSDVINFIDQ